MDKFIFQTGALCIASTLAVPRGQGVRGPPSSPFPDFILCSAANILKEKKKPFLARFGSQGSRA